MRNLSFKAKMSMAVICIGLLGLGILFLKGLRLDPRYLPSMLIQKPLPEFTLDNLFHPGQPIRTQDLYGEPALLHIWATWCGVCAKEHSDLMRIAQQWAIPIYGISYKDHPAAVKHWLKEKGNPYRLSMNDDKGLVALDLGVYGTPETFLMNKEGIILARHVGRLTEAVFKEDFLPKLKDFNSSL